MPTKSINDRMPKYVEAALPVPLRRTFTYKVPAGFADEIKIGARILVPFGNRTATGYAVALAAEFDADSDVEESAVKSVYQLIDPEPLITPEIVELTKWAADYYFASWGEMLKASLPAGINSAVEPFAKITDNGQRTLAGNRSKALKYRVLERIAETGEVGLRELVKEFGGSAAKRAFRELTREGFITADERTVATKVKPKVRKFVRAVGGTETDKKLTDGQRKVLDALKEVGGESVFMDIVDNYGVSASSINTLAKYGLVEIFTGEVLRDPFADSAPAELNKITLNDEQSHALAEITKPIDSGEFRAFLLHGITGSGKTEVYIRAIRRTLEKGRSALMLVPEIALTPMFSNRLRSIFGGDVAILHSNLSAGERFDEWRRIRRGDARVVIGTRSAIFAPLSDIGLLIVDEEHDGSYRQHESPYYNARDTAVIRAHNANAVVVLGSATPSLESFNNTLVGKYEYLRLENRIGGRPLANAELIDMRDVFKREGKDVPFSPELVAAIEATHAKGEQAIILLNRRGFSQFVMCRSCGENIKCKNCDITLTYHRIGAKLICHYCGYFENAPKVCPKCASEYLYYIGEGTEKIENELGKLFPHLRIERVDRDTMSTRGQMQKILHAFDRNEIDMLVGTQMLAKGHDFHNVTLVGVLSIDIGLGLPDFRAAERTFQLLTQAAGRAGRGRLPGKVLIQTYFPEHYALRHAARQDFGAFSKEELGFRKRSNFPPYVSLASVTIKHKDRQYALDNARILGESLSRANAARECHILGPAEAAIARLKGEYRFQILIRSANRKSMRKVIDIGTAEAESRRCDMTTVQIEIDPIDLM
jgi:primosomal protein N' (replication factor Y)